MAVLYQAISGKTFPEVVGFRRYPYASVPQLDLGAGIRICMTRRGGIDRLNDEIAARARSKRYFDLCEERLDYEPLKGLHDDTPYFQLNKMSLEMSARLTGPAFCYNLYVHTIRLFQARNVVFQILAHTKSNPFAPYVNIIECPALDESEWVLEANDKRVGSAIP